METTLDIRGLPEERVEYLKSLTKLWKKDETKEQEQKTPKPIVKRKVRPEEFIVKKSRIIEGKMTRAMAYEDGYDRDWTTSTRSSS